MYLLRETFDRVMYNAEVDASGYLLVGIPETYWQAFHGSLTLYSTKFHHDTYLYLLVFKFRGDGYLALRVLVKYI